MVQMLKEMGCPEDGFRIRANTEAEVLKHVKIHLADAHGAKEVSPDMEKDIKSKIKDVSV